MAAIATENDIPTGTGLKDRRVVFDTTNPASEPLVPVEESKLFIHGNADPSSLKGWALPGIGFPTLTAITLVFNLTFRSIVATFGLIDSVLNLLWYPVSGLVILAFVYEYFSDVYLYDHNHEENAMVSVVSTAKLTTTVTQAMTSTVSPTASYLTEELQDEDFAVPLGENTIKLPNFPVSPIAVVVKTKLGTHVSTAFLSEATSQATEEALAKKS
ncbi:hypothetical protein BKA65DRAFT_558690 [Rhexocercosporidium sp. MPI-PUGE-AT-0058]|nr:hypothetical protein BKA65DRAFT_558690 [Rhexocercosporidium sp. MPI-PUGE-AT-0058]